MSLYITTSEINGLQSKLIRFANEWVRKEKTPIPQKEIVAFMKENNVTLNGTKYELGVLIKKNYLKRVKIYGLGTMSFYTILRSV